MTSATAQKREIVEQQCTEVIEKAESCQLDGQALTDVHDLEYHASTLGEPKSHICQECGLVFPEEVVLKSHLLAHSDEGPQAGPDGSKPKYFGELRCLAHTEHKADSRQREDLKPSLLLNAKGSTYIFKIRSLKVSQTSDFKSHSLMHTIQRPHTCEICGRGFIEKGSLRKHFLTHTGEKPHTCEICGRGFSLKPSLRKHLLTHTGEKPHSCELCGRKFSEKGSLKKHLMTHTGEKPHSCEICGRGFSEKRSLRNHLLTHTSEKSHSCETIGR